MIINYPADSKPAKDALDYDIGTTFTGTLSDFTGLFLRTHTGVVMLDDPNHTWSSSRNVMVTDFRVVRATVKVENI